MGAWQGVGAVSYLMNVMTTSTVRLSSGKGARAGLVRSNLGVVLAVPPLNAIIPPAKSPSPPVIVTDAGRLRVC